MSSNEIKKEQKHDNNKKVRFNPVKVIKKTKSSPLYMSRNSKGRNLGPLYMSKRKSSIPHSKNSEDRDKYLSNLNLLRCRYKQL